MTFSGSALRILWHNSLSIPIIGLAVSIGLLGGNWSYLFLASLAAVLPVVAVVTAVLAWANRFSLDDARQAFVKPGGRTIPYDRVIGVYLAQRGRSLDVFVKRGWMHMTALAEAVPAGQAEQLRRELEGRFPGRLHRRSRWTSFAPVIVICILLLLLLAGSHLFLYRRYPQLHRTVGTLEPAETKAKRVRPPVEFVEDFGFTPPEGYRYVGENKGELYFEDGPRKQRLKVVGILDRKLLREQADLFRYAMGVRNYADLLDLTYSSRFGVIPLFLRAQDLAGLEEVALYSFGPPLRGFIRQGRREKTEETHIVVFGERPGQEVHFFFSGPKRIPERTLRRFVAGIKLLEIPAVSGAGLGLDKRGCSGQAC